MYNRIIMLLVFSSLALADDGSSYTALGAGIGMGLAAGLGGIGLGKAISTGLEATGRNPGASGKIMVTMLIGLAFIELAVILTFVIAQGLSG
jgi:F-type H+-transporting ATPase subunit c